VLGRMPKDGAFSALSQEYTVLMQALDEGWVLPSVDKAWGVGLALRWLGYNATMSYKGVERVANWAPNSTSIAARPFTVKGPDRHSVVLTGVTARRNIFTPMPALAADQTIWKVSVMSTDNISISSQHARVSMTGVYVRPAPRGDEIIIPPVGAIQAVPIVLEATHRADVHMSGFRIVMDTTTAHPAEAVSQAVASVAEAEPVMEAELEER